MVISHQSGIGEEIYLWLEEFSSDFRPIQAMGNADWTKTYTVTTQVKTYSKKHLKITGQIFIISQLPVDVWIKKA